MCRHDPNQLETLVRQAVVSTSAVVASSQPQACGSRRRRVWELDDHAHCPVIGVCIPFAVLRHIVDKVLGGHAVANDYELHCGVVADCKRRTKVAEAAQKELDRRYMASLRQAAKIKSTNELMTWWAHASEENLAGALWATLTHARCTPALEHDVLGRVHMIQHQVGASTRADLQRFESLIDENAVLARALAQAQRRNTNQAEEHGRRSELQQGQIIQLRAALIGRDTSIAALQDSLLSLEAAAPGLKSRFELARQGQRQVERIHQLERALLQSQQEADKHRRRAEDLADQAHRKDTFCSPHDGQPDTSVTTPPRLDERAVLCVGGRQASIPIYRNLIEQAGGRFLHHDGGEEESAARLDATLAAADLVICQTGCVSHDAYWRVKNHCKRTGKQCVFVENPSASSLVRGLEQLSTGDNKAQPAHNQTAD